MNPYTFTDGVRTFQVQANSIDDAREKIAHRFNIFPEFLTEQKTHRETND